MGRDPAFSGKGSTAGPLLTTSLLGSLFLQTFLASDRSATGPEKPIGKGCVPGAPAVAGPEAGEPGAHSPDSCWEVRRRQHSGKRWLAAPDCAPILFPPPEGVSRATPTSRLCTLHHNRADVTEKLSPPPPKTQGRESGRGCCPCCGSLCTLWRSLGEIFTWGLRAGLKGSWSATWERKI